MSGNLWMFSDMLDDEDIEMLKRDFITYEIKKKISPIYTKFSLRNNRCTHSADGIRQGWH